MLYQLSYNGLRVVPPENFEISTHGLKVRCSASELQGRKLFIHLFMCFVGMTGFELATPRSQSGCSTKLSYIPLVAIPRIELGLSLYQSDVITISLYGWVPRIVSRPTVLRKCGFTLWSCQGTL
jgi:hypothetical protein